MVVILRAALRRGARCDPAPDCPGRRELRDSIRRILSDLEGVPDHMSEAGAGVGVPPAEHG
jgi:hypothetical protein